jgi:hypothetical protein
MWTQKPVPEVQYALGKYVEIGVVGASDMQAISDDFRGTYTRRDSSAILRVVQQNGCIVDLRREFAQNRGIQMLYLGPWTASRGARRPSSTRSCCDILKISGHSQFAIVDNNSSAHQPP